MVAFLKNSSCLQMQTNHTVLMESQKNCFDKEASDTSCSQTLHQINKHIVR